MYCQNCESNTSTKVKLRGKANEQKEVCKECDSPKKMEYMGHFAPPMHPLPHHMMGHPLPIDIPPHIAYLLTKEEYKELMEKLISRSR